MVKCDVYIGGSFLYQCFFSGYLFLSNKVANPIPRYSLLGFWTGISFVRAPGEVIGSKNQRVYVGFTEVAQSIY